MAVLLHDAGSLNKVTQTLLEMVRGGVETLPLEMTVFCLVNGDLDPAFVGRLPFSVRTVPDGDPRFLDAVRGRRLRLCWSVRIVGHVSRRGHRWRWRRT